MAAANPFKVKDLIAKYGWQIMPYLSNLGVNVLAEAAVLFVDSEATNALDADDGEHGHSFERPLATLNYAISLCTASQGDVILLGPGHAETIEDTGTASGTTTDEVTVDKAGIHIIGIGVGSRIPTFTLEGATDAAIVVLAGATDVHIKNIKIVSNLADVAAGMTLSATSDGAVIEDCIFRDGAAAKELVIGLSIAADCDNITVRNCHFSTVASGGCGAAIRLAGGCDNSVFEGNVAYGTYSTSAFDADVAASLNLILKNNVFCNEGAAACELHASTTGVMSENYIGGTTSVAAALTGDTAIFCFENYVNGNVGESGTISPAVE